MFQAKAITLLLNCENMKYIFTIETSGDGLMPACFTNIKAIFNYINLEGLALDKISADDKDVKYTYSNLVRVIRDNQSLKRMNVCNMFNDYGDSLTINQLLVKSN